MVYVSKFKKHHKFGLNFRLSFIVITILTMALSNAEASKALFDDEVDRAERSFSTATIPQEEGRLKLKPKRRKSTPAVYYRAIKKEKDESFTLDSKPHKTVRVLSIDGGGIRGIIPTKILQHIEEETGEPIAHQFDVIAGTSIGGLIALGLAIEESPGVPKYSAKDLSRIFEDRGQEIFYRSFWHRLLTLGGAIGTKYSSESVEHVLEDYFGDAYLSDVATNVLVPTVTTERHTPYKFLSDMAKDDPKHDFLMRDVARATSAAPTYFSPALIHSCDGDRYSCVDGGIAQNNPALSAVAHARLLFPDADDFLIVSVGTGKPVRSISYESVQKAGILQWASKLFTLTLDSHSMATHDDLRAVFPDMEGRQRYFRIQPIISEGNEELDDASTKNLRALKIAAESAIEDSYARQLHVICNELSSGECLTRLKRASLSDSEDEEEDEEVQLLPQVQRSLSKTFSQPLSRSQE